MKTMKMLAVAAGLLAIPFGAVAETAVTDSQAARDVTLGYTAPYAGTALGTDRIGSGEYQARTGVGAVIVHTAMPDTAWSDNYLAGRVHEPAGY